MKQLSSYTDGSYNPTKKQASWAFIIVDNDNIIHKDKGIILDETWNFGHQVAGECLGIIKALAWARENNVKLTVFYDFQNLKYWVNDIWGEKPWKTNKEYTILYREKVLSMKENIVDFVKVKSHSGDRFNELADQLAKTN